MRRHHGPAAAGRDIDGGRNGDRCGRVRAEGRGGRRRRLDGRRPDGGTSRGHTRAESHGSAASRGRWGGRRTSRRDGDGDPDPDPGSSDRHLRSDGSGSGARSPFRQWPPDASGWSGPGDAGSRLARRRASGRRLPSRRRFTGAHRRSPIRPRGAARRTGARPARACSGRTRRPHRRDRHADQGRGPRAYHRGGAVPAELIRQGQGRLLEVPRHQGGSARPQRRGHPA